MSETQAETVNEHQLQKKDVLQVVSFNLHEEEYAIEITKVKEIILLEGVTHVPQMPDFIEGIINLRGNIIPVIDLRKRFNLPCSEQTDQTRIVVTRMDERIVGLIVDSVSQVMKIPHGDIQEPPDTIAGVAGEYLEGIGKTDNRMILLLDIEKIMTNVEKQRLFKASSQGAEAPEAAVSATEQA